MLVDADKACGLPWVALRYFNAAGADPNGDIGEDHDPETHLIPLVLRAARDETAVEIYGIDYDTKDRTCVRDYIHVVDIVRRPSARARISARKTRKLCPEPCQRARLFRERSGRRCIARVWVRYNT